MLWIKWRQVPQGSTWARYTGSAVGDDASRRGKAELQQEETFPVPKRRAAESCECQQDRAACLPQEHSGGSALQELCLDMLGRRAPVFTPYIYLPMH